MLTTLTPDHLPWGITLGSARQINWGSRRGGWPRWRKEKDKKIYKKDKRIKMKEKNNWGVEGGVGREGEKKIVHQLLAIHGQFGREGKAYSLKIRTNIFELFKHVSCWSLGGSSTLIH